jgi:hypothetical protein
MSFMGTYTRKQTLRTEKETAFKTNRTESLDCVQTALKSDSFCSFSAVLSYNTALKKKTSGL